ncbi:TRAP transporter small permease subunit [Amorphus sp. 3PC139-8]|uniref:TRAP transporter small permease subunit n=1 Tax=Amorphus sp. 3PC139-8 TaxID=2735676 RepID=UPI00345CA607
MSSTQTTAPSGPSAGGAPSAVRRAWNTLVDGFAALGTVLICVLMLIIASDVVARNLVGGSLPLVSELGALTLVMIVYLQLGTTIRHDRLARTEFLFGALCAARPRLGQLVGALYDLIGAGIVGAMAWATIHIVEKDLASHEFIGVTGVLTVPVWPFRVLILAGLTIAALQFLLQTVDALRGRGAATASKDKT